MLCGLLFLRFMIGSDPLARRAALMNPITWILRRCLWMQYQPGVAATEMWPAARSLLRLPKQQSSASHACVSDAAAFSDRLNARRFSIWMRLYGHECLLPVGGPNLHKVCSECLCHWVHINGLGAVWLQCYDQGTNKPLICILEESAYKFRLARLMRHFWRSILDRDAFQYSIVSHEDLCSIGYSFPDTWFLTRCNSFRDALNVSALFSRKA